jgi:hypothetical protein
MSMDKTAKKAIMDIVDHITYYDLTGEVANGQNYLVVFTRRNDGVISEVVALDGEHIGIQYGSDEHGNPQLEIPLPAYENEIFVEDEKDALILDLTFLVGQWVADLKRIEAGRRGGKKGSANLTPEERKERASKAARARWGKHNQSAKRH